jgi:tetratricopeptide (TPR) repeat protein
MSPRFAKACLSICLLVVCVWVSATRAQIETDFDKATAEFQAGNYVAAASLFARVENDQPGKTAALLFRGKCLAQLQDFRGAEESLRHYISGHPDSADALFMLGFVLNRLNRPAESLKAYTQGAKFARPTGDDLKIVALDYVLVNDYADAIKWLEEAVKRDPKNEDAWYYLGRAYYTKARMGEARKAFETVLTINPRSVKAENNLGLILENEGKAAEALGAYRTAIAWQQESPNPSEQPYVNLGNLLMEQGQIKDAIPPLEKAVALAPNSAFCRMTLGMAYRQLGELERAQGELEKGQGELEKAHGELGRAQGELEKAGGESEKAHGELGRAQGELEKARVELEKATQLEPDNAKAHYQLGRLYKDMHALDRAQAEFQKTEELKARSAGLKAPENP